MEADVAAFQLLLSRTLSWTVSILEGLISLAGPM